MHFFRTCSNGPMDGHIESSSGEKCKGERELRRGVSARQQRGPPPGVKPSKSTELYLSADRDLLHRGMRGPPKLRRLWPAQLGQVP